MHIYELREKVFHSFDAILETRFGDMMVMETTVVIRVGRGVQGPAR
jgi:hypothetical protein